MIARLPGTMMAAPTPCTERAAISEPGPGARAQPSDAAMKIPMPTTKVRRSPNLSPAAHPARMSAESVTA